MDKIIITGSFRFPDGDAAASRVLGVGKVLRDSGYLVEFAGWEESERIEDLMADGSFVYQGFSYESQSDLRVGSLPPLRRLLRYLLAGSNTLKRLRESNLDNVRAIIAYHGGSVFLLRLFFLCRLRNIKLIFDCTEWYDSRSLVGGRFGLVRIDNEFRMRILNPLIGYGIVISSYLEKYFSGKCCRVVWIPPLVDLTESKWNLDLNAKSDRGSLSLVYAGTPGKKDLLGNALRGLAQLKNEGADIRLHIIGPDYKAILDCVDGDVALLDQLSTMLVLHGRQRQSDVPKMLATADFSILLRPQERYANAGFSTKLVESLAAGVPVIANATGDINAFITDGKEGVILRDHTPSAFVDGVKRVLAMNPSQRSEMRSNAYDLAVRRLDYRSYTGALSKWIRDVLDESH